MPFTVTAGLPEKNIPEREFRGYQVITLCGIAFRQCYQQHGLKAVAHGASRTSIEVSWKLTTFVKKRQLPQNFWVLPESKIMYSQSRGQTHHRSRTLRYADQRPPAQQPDVSGYFFFLWRSRFNLFLRLCVAILRRFRFFPLGISCHLLSWTVYFYFTKYTLYFPEVFPSK